MKGKFASNKGSFMDGLKQASKSWNVGFGQTIKTYGFQQNLDEPYIYKHVQRQKVIFWLYNLDEPYIYEHVKKWLSQQFDMDLEEASYILEICILRDRKNMIALSLASYIDKILSRFAM